MNKICFPITTLATCVAGVVLFCTGCGDDAGSNGAPRTSRPADGANGASGTPRPTGLIPDASERSRGASRTSRPTDAPWPDEVARILVEHAVNGNDYESLAKLRDKLDKIEDPDVRLRLLEGLSWFDETAVADALSFMLDPDDRVATLASEIVTSHMSSVKRPSQRKKLYAVALKLMPDDSPDRELLMATLENDKERVIIGVLADFEPSKDSDPALWKRLTEAYETATGRPYKDYVDALIHYNPRDDR